MHLNRYFRSKTDIRSTLLRIAHFPDPSAIDCAIAPPSVAAAESAVESAIATPDDPAPLELLCAFTSRDSFSFVRPLPSQLFTALHDHLRPADDLAPLCLALLTNLWTHYDADLAVLADPDLIAAVWDCCFLPRDSHSVPALHAILALCDSDYGALCECRSPSAIGHTVAFLNECPANVLLLFLYFMLSIASSDDRPLLLPHVPRLLALVTGGPSEAVQAVAAEVLLHAAQSAEIGRSIASRSEWVGAILAHVAASANFEAVMALYALLREIEFYELGDDDFECLIGHLRASHQRPAPGLYHFLAGFVGRYPLFLVEHSLLRELLALADDSSVENKRLLAVVIASGLAAPELGLEGRAALIAAGALDFLALLLPVFDIEGALVVAGLLTAFLEGDDGRVRAAIAKCGLLEGIEEIGEQEGSDELAAASASLIACIG
jgi:hypothetical protein